MCCFRSAVTWPLQGILSPWVGCWRPSVEVTTDWAHAYRRVLDEQLPAVLHVVERYANNLVEADHSPAQSTASADAWDATTAIGADRLRWARLLRQQVGGPPQTGSQRPHLPGSGPATVDGCPTQHQGPRYLRTSRIRISCPSRFESGQLCTTTIDLFEHVGALRYSRAAFALTLRSRVSLGSASRQ